MLNIIIIVDARERLLHMPDYPTCAGDQCRITVAILVDAAMTDGCYIC